MYTSMTKQEFRKLCDKYQTGDYSEGFNIYGLLGELEGRGIEFDDLESHDMVKEWLKHCIDEEYNVGYFITAWWKEGFADYYKVDFSMGAMASITALAVADDFYDCYESWFEDGPEDEEEENEEGDDGE